MQTHSILCHSLIHASELAQLWHQGHTISLYWITDCELHLEMWLIRYAFKISLNLFSTGTGTNSSLNEQCTNVIIIIKLWWQELSLKQHVPLVQKYDTNHRHDAQSAQGNLLFALGAFLNNNIPLKEKNWWNLLCANAPSNLKASTLWYNVQINFLLTW